MAEPATLRWRFRAIYVALALAVAFVQLLPLGAQAGRLPGPDLILCLTFAWVLRRPDFVPVALVALVMLAADILFLRPPGLWAAFGVAGYEMLRSRSAVLRDRSFVLEWATVAGVIVAMTLLQTMVLAVFVVIRPMFGLTLAGMLATIFAYPVVVLVSVRLLGVRRAPPSGAISGLRA